MVSFRGLSDLHIVPRGKTLTSDFYADEVQLKEMVASAMRRRTENGPPTAVKLMPDMSPAICQQDGSQAHIATKTQQWCQVNLTGF